MIPIHQILFYIFAVVLIVSAFAMIFSRNPVRAALCLILCFFASSVLWLLLQAEFIGLVLIIVYVGAVMTLFLFVVMMLNIDKAQVKEGFAKLAPLGLIIAALFVVAMYLVITRYHFHTLALKPESVAYSSTKAIGTLIFTHYVYPFEIAGALLLVAMVAAITLAFGGKRKGMKTQNISQQQAVTKKSRLKIVKDMKP